MISQAIGAHPQVIVAPVDHPLVGRRGLDKEDLAKESFIIREEGSGTRTVFDYFFDGVQVHRPHIKFEIGSNETIKQAVMAGLGLSLISAHTIEAEVASGRLAILDVKGLPIIRQWYLVRRANWTPTPVGEAIWDFAVAHAAEFMPDVAITSGARAGLRFGVTPASWTRMNANSCNASVSAAIARAGWSLRRDISSNRPPADEEIVTMLEKKTLIAALMATTFLTAGVAFAADQAAQPSAQQAAAAKDAGKLSADGTRAYNDLAMTRLAIYDGRVADAKKLIADADTAFDKAKTDDSVFMKAEGDLKSPDGAGGAQKTEASETAPTDPNAAKQEKSAKVYAQSTLKRWLPVDADMSVDEDFTANPAKKAAVADANKSLEKGDSQGAMSKLKLADVSMTYVMAVVPLDQTIADVHQAAQLVDGGKYYEASQMLRQVQDSTRYDVVEASGVPGKATDANAVTH